MKKISNLLMGALLVLIVSACAGGKRNHNTPVAPRLPKTVPESFHFRVNDPGTRAYLHDIDTEILPADQRLQVFLLRELTAVSSETEISVSFDRLWKDHEELKTMVRFPREGRRWIQAMAIAYYFLSTAPATSWQAQAAERIHREGLVRVTPARLTGYSLHFYTLALLKKGEFNDALPFLHGLEQFTDPETYLQDLMTAMDYAMAGRETEAACSIIRSICETGMRHHLKLPDNRLKKAILALKANGNFTMLREEFETFIPAYPALEKYSFIKLLILPEDAFQKKGSKCDGRGKSAQIETQNGPIKTVKKTDPKKPFASLHKEANAEGVQIEIEFISAFRDSDYPDTFLTDSIKDLGKSVHASGFRLLAKKLMKVSYGEEGRVTLSEDWELIIMPHYSTKKTCRIQLMIIKEGKRTYSTVLEAMSGGSAIIGKRVDDKRILLLRLKEINILKGKTVDEPYVKKQFEFKKETIQSKKKGSSYFKCSASIESYKISKI